LIFIAISFILLSHEHILKIVIKVVKLSITCRNFSNY